MSDDRYRGSRIRVPTPWVALAVAVLADNEDSAEAARALAKQVLEASERQ